ncbi:MAG TPA: hypothetical protein VK645_16080, partial [Chitinophagaceae bacterium]|nr:hypothetical protein [Chitinophagaceae bacterium]
MSIANTFPVFEPDQVLTNQHLNDLFNYLDQQDRLTRCKLMGSGIVCGLEISHTSDTINITKGCGLTSQGYIILFCDHTGEEGYKYYMPFTRPAFPNDLQLISQCPPDPNRNNILFYASDVAGAASNNPIQLLLTQKEFDALADKTGVIPLSQGSNLSQYAVVLFLDASEQNLKNCDTNDCNDKGSRMELTIVPLLVDKILLFRNNGNGEKSTYQPVRLRRYNVPLKNLTSSDAVLNAFVALMDDATLSRLANDLEYCFLNYQYLLNGITTNPFGSLADFKKNLLFIIKFHPVLIQYYYDFIYDLLKALYEFRYKAHSITSECCGDEMKFPFHLTLGEATVNTSTAIQSAYRQYFVYSPLFDAQNDGSNELRSLLMRMILMYQQFLIVEKSFLESKTVLPRETKITPSNYGHYSLSDRCIPYYYSPVQQKNAVVPGDLYYYWDFSKTKRGNAGSNLSYNAAAYSNADMVINPLFYEIEWYNFYRVEGHIGKNINTALTEVKSLQQNFNLPFDTVALSADYIGALVKGEEPQCSILDLESDYRILIAEFICKLHDTFCYVAKLGFTPPLQILTGVFTNATAGASGSTTRKSAGAKKTAATKAKTAEKLLAAIPDTINIVTDHPFISGLVSEFQAIAAYTKGNTLVRLCAPAANTIGSYYNNSIIANKGKFVNPIQATDSSANAVLYRHFFEFTDSVESMLQILMTNSLSVLNTSSFKAAYNRFEAEVNVINMAMLDFIKALDANDKIPDFTIDYLLDLFVDNVQMVMHTCIVERLDALKSEYLRRVAQYRLAKNFSYYFRTHSGIEHKAGVPRGGTFILVYHEERRNRLVDINSLYINSELSSTLLTNFRELLSDDVQLDTLEAKAKMLAVATLYQDPALYLRFKDVMQQYLDNCTNLPPDKKTQISVIINQPPSAASGFQLTDGMVIADFYVPYMCCSDCPPIAYILPTPPAPPDDKPVVKAISVCRSVKELPLEPNLPAGAIIKVLTSEGNIMDDKLIIHPSATGINKTTVFH